MNISLNPHIVKTRKNHICFGCGRTFIAGVNMERSGIVDGGTVWTCYLCESCIQAMKDLDWDDEFGFTDLREASLEIERKNIRNEIS